MKHITNHRAIWSLAKTATALAIAAAAGFGLVGCGNGYELDPTGGSANSPTATTSPGPTGDPGGGPPQGDDGSSDGTGSGSGSGTGSGNGTGSGTGSSGNGGAAEPGNAPPYIRDLYQDAYVYGNGDGVEATIQGHAFDPDGPDSQENVARVDVDWGDGSTTAAGLGGHGAFDASYDYDISYAGMTMTVRVVAYGHDGQTATKSVQLALPAE